MAPSPRENAAALAYSLSYGTRVKPVRSTDPWGGRHAPAAGWKSCGIGIVILEPWIQRVAGPRARDDASRSSTGQAVAVASPSGLRSDVFAKIDEMTMPIS